MNESVRNYIALMDDAIVWNQARALPGGGSGNRLRLDALSRRVDRDEADRASTRPPGWAYRLDRKIVVDLLLEVLLPHALDELSDTLHAQRREGEADPGVWAPLDRASFKAVVDTIRRRELVAETEVRAALEGFARKPSNAGMRVAVRALEDLHDTRMHLNPFFDHQLLVSEGTNLDAALRSVLPQTARDLISSLIERAFRRELERTSIELLPPVRGFWHHEIPGLGIWYPLWHRIRGPAAGSNHLGTWFVPDVQETYERWHAEAESLREREERDRELRRRAAAGQRERDRLAEEERKIREARWREGWADRRERESQVELPAIVRLFQAQQGGSEEDEIPRRAGDVSLSEEARRRAAENAERLVQAELDRRREERRQERDRAQRRSDHRLQSAAVESSANRDRVRRFMKSRGMQPKDLTPQTRMALRREFRH